MKLIRHFILRDESDPQKLPPPKKKKNPYQLSLNREGEKKGKREKEDRKIKMVGFPKLGTVQATQHHRAKRIAKNKNQ